MINEKSTREEVLKTVKQNGLSLYFASQELKNDKEVVLEAVKENGWALKYASKELQNDKEVVLKATKEMELALQYASQKLKNDLSFLSVVVDELGINVLEKSNLKEVYEDLKLKEYMKDDLASSSKRKKTVKKF